MANDSVRGARTADLVSRRISGAILHGELPPGTRLREESLAAVYEVSRTPIREALIQLSSIGLVELIPNRGATVLELTLEDVSEVYHLRAVLEGEAASLAAKAATPEMISFLEKACDRLAQLHRAPGAEQLAADTEFHYRIAEASGSGRLTALIRQVSTIPEAYRSMIAYSSEDMSEAERQHRTITGELRGHRSAGAARLMRRHVYWAGELAVRRLEQRLPR